jgi:hypothetical protein
MFRLWLLLLAFVLPLQMSWAAVHFCNDAAAAVTVSESLQDHNHAASGGQDDSAGQVDCCAAAHGCHGLHNLMATEQAQLSVPTLSNIVPITDDESRQRQFAARHERPQWSAA